MSWPSLEEAKKDPRYYEPKQDALEALRSAVVAQTALLRELSQQVRLSFEAQQAEYLSQQFEVAKQLAALEQVAEQHNSRLDKLASWLEAIQHTQSKQNQTLTRKNSKPAAARRKAKR